MITWSTLATYTYDGDGVMVKSVVNGGTTYYVGSYELEINGKVTTERKYYSAAGMRIAMRTQVDGGDETLNWLIGDHLGSTSMVTSASGVKESEVRYSAFGEIREQTGATPTDYLYTGQRQETELGLYYYVARWCDPALGRFIWLRSNWRTFFSGRFAAPILKPRANRVWAPRCSIDREVYFESQLKRARITLLGGKAALIPPAPGIPGASLLFGQIFSLRHTN